MSSNGKWTEFIPSHPVYFRAGNGFFFFHSVGFLLPGDWVVYFTHKQGLFVPIGDDMDWWWFIMLSNGNRSVSSHPLVYLVLCVHEQALRGWSFFFCWRVGFYFTRTVCFVPIG